MFRSTAVVKTAFKSLKLKPQRIECKNYFRNMSSVTTWNKDWKPGPYPHTKEQKIAAAKKYNMIPEDYEPYPEEEGFGDYPMFKKVHMENRNAHEPFDWESTKRNYGEPLHPDFDLCQEDRYNFDKKYRTPLWKQYIILWSIVGVAMSAIYWDATHPTDLKRIPKQYPYSGQIHYTFEAVE